MGLPEGECGDPQLSEARHKAGPVAPASPSPQAALLSSTCSGKQIYC